MGIFGIIRSCENVFYSLYNGVEPILNLLNGGYWISGSFYSLFDILFGVGLPTFLGACIIKWLIGIIT